MDWLKNWLSPQPAPKPAPHYRPQFDKIEPASAQPGTVHIVGESRRAWALLLKCPCGCGDDIWLNLLKGHPQRWRYRVRQDQVTIRPSINRVVGCRSHFLITNGEVEWCKDDDYFSDDGESDDHHAEM